MTGLVTEWKAANTVYLDFSKAFDTVFIKMLRGCGLDVLTAKQIDNQLNVCAQRVEVSGMKSWRSIDSSVSLESVLGLTLFNISMRGQSAPPANLQTTSNWEECPIGQRNLERLEKWVDRNLTKLTKEKSRVLLLGRRSPGSSARAAQLESSSAAKDLGPWARKIPWPQGGSVASWAAVGWMHPQQVGRDDPSLLLSTGEASRAVLCPIQPLNAVVSLCSAPLWVHREAS